MNLACAQGKTLFKSGDLGYACFRIPALVSLSPEVLIAFAEGRKDSCADFGDVDILMRRSQDGGRTWTYPQRVADFGALQVGNPTPVVDRLDSHYPEGRLFLFYNTGTASEQQTREGKGRRQGYFITSTDAGRHWSEPTLISDTTHYDRFHPTKNLDDRTLAYAPGHALQLYYGPHKGRLIVPANASRGPAQEEFREYRAFVLYSDDHGKQWQRSESLKTPSSNEVMAAQLPSGEVLMTVRIQNSTERRKFIARSISSGDYWDSEKRAEDLVNPVCQSSILYVPEHQKLYHLGPNSETARENLTLWSSMDGGYGWQVVQQLNEDFAAYSDLAYLQSNILAILYERFDYSEIYFNLITVP
ncbi:MAG: sialidase family protein [Flavobacteriaceae bacterium]